MLLPPDQIMRAHFTPGEIFGLGLAALLGLAAVVGGLENLIGVVRGQPGPNPQSGAPKFDWATAVLGIAVGSLFIGIAVFEFRQTLKTRPQEQRAELVSTLTDARDVPAGTFVQYARVGAVGLNDFFDNGTALSQYVHDRDLASVKVLLDAGASVDAGDADHQPPLLTAVRQSDLPMVQLLLAAHADPNHAGDNPSILDAVDPMGAEPDDLSDTEPGTERPPPTAAETRELDARRRDLLFDREAIVAALVAAGANLNVRDERSYTPLMIAAAAGECELIAPLVLGHADLSLQANTGETAADWARSEGHPECLPLLRSGEQGQAAAAVLAASVDAQRQSHPSAERLARERFRQQLKINLAQSRQPNIDAARAMHSPFRWLKDIASSFLLSFLASLVVSTLAFVVTGLYHTLRGDPHPFRWRWIAVFVGSSSSSSDGESSSRTDGPENVAGGGGKFGGGGAGGSY